MTTLVHLALVLPAFPASLPLHRVRLDLWVLWMLLARRRLKLLRLLLQVAPSVAVVPVLVLWTSVSLALLSSLALVLLVLAAMQRSRRLVAVRCSLRG